MVTGCTVKLKDDPSMALACQFRECVCHPQTYNVLMETDTLPVEWRENGDAYCLEGYVLTPPKDASGARQYPDRPKEFGFPRIF